jgi:hypothetical protein
VGAETPPEEEYVPPKRRRKRSLFKRGFFTAILIFALLWLLYLFAPRIIAALPQVEPILTPYVAFVDQLRIWLDGALQAFARWLDDKAASSVGSTGGIGE